MEPEPEPEPEPDCFPGAGAGAGADQKCYGSASLPLPLGIVYWCCSQDFRKGCLSTVGNHLTMKKPLLSANILGKVGLSLVTG